MFVSREIEFPYTCDLGELLRFVPPESALHDRAAEISSLSGYYSFGKAPHEVTPASHADVRNAIEIARFAIQTVAVELQSRNAE